MHIKRYKILLFGIFFFLVKSPVFNQAIDHWETIIYNSDEWRYQIGNSSVPENWNQLNFDNQNWNKSIGGFGYGDGDDNKVLPNINSIFLIRKFEVIDSSLLSKMVLHADYDDGFVAYLNGTEIARSNMGGTAGIKPNYDARAIEPHEARLYQGGLPETYILDEGLVKGLIKQGDNVLAIQVHNYGDNSSDFSSNFFFSVGILDNSNLYKRTPDWFEQSIWTTTLPIIKINTENGQNIENDPKVNAEMGIIFKGGGEENSIFDIPNIYDGKIAIELRGTSSLWFDKKGYGFETRNEDGSNNNVELLGMPKENDWVLHGPYSDKSLLRNVLTYHMGNLTGQYAPRTRLCELVINGEYLGVYVLTEKIKQDKNRVDISKMTPEDDSGDELSGGYMIKVDRNEQNIPDIGWTSSFPDNKFFAFVEPQADDITSNQTDYIQRFVYNFELAMWQNDYEDRYLEYIDLQSWADYFLVTEMGKHIDAYKLSFYMYKDRGSIDGKLHMGPLWDFNLGYGNFDFECSPDPQGWAHEFPDCGSWHPFWARKISDIPNVQHFTNCRWQELRNGPFQTSNLLAFIDQKVEEIGTGADRNFERWQVLGQYLWPNDYIGDTYEEEVNFLKQWLEERLNWMDDNMVGNCEDYISNSEDVLVSNIEIKPNPTSDYIDLILPEFKKGTLEIQDHFGKTFFRSFIESENDLQKIDVSMLTNGMYIVSYNSDENRIKKVFSKLTILRN